MSREKGLQAERLRVMRGWLVFTLTSESAALLSAPSDDAWLLHSNDWPAPSGGLASSPPPSFHSELNNKHNWVITQKQRSPGFCFCFVFSKPRMKTTTTYMQNTDMCDTALHGQKKKIKIKTHEKQLKIKVGQRLSPISTGFFFFKQLNQFSWWHYRKENNEYLPSQVAGRVQKHSHS